MDRKTFIKKTIRAILITLPLAAIIGCSNSDDGSETPNPTPTPQSKCAENGALGSVELNHGHSLVISKEDVIAAKRKTYDIQGTADHNHTLTVTSENFTAMKSRGLADIYSSTDNDHRHSVFVRCAQ